MHNKTSHQSACWCAMNSRLLGLGLALCSPSLLASDIMLYVQQQANHVNLVLHPLPSATETCASPVELTQALTIEQSTLHYSVQGCQHGQQVVYDGASKLRMSLLQWLEQAAQQPNVNVGLAVQTAQGIQQRIAIAPLTATQRLQLARQIVDWQVAGDATAFADSVVLSLQKMASQCTAQGQTTGFSVGLQTALNQQHLQQDSEQLQRTWQQAWHQFHQPSSSATWYATAPSILQGIAQAMTARQVGYSFHFNASSLLGLWTGNVNSYRYTAAGWSHILPNGRLNMQATGEWGNAQQGMLAQLPVGDR
ncbi:MAG: hypothetical protein Q4D05_03830, partial [Acinetobacter sp.]|nr:hypothetical protein [Acinetobacter sp.]